MNSADRSPVQVEHDVTHHRFVVANQEARAVAEYERQGDRIVFTHTYVPAEFRGRGIAQELVRAGLEFARSEKLKVVPACSYVATFIERNPEYQAMLAPKG